MDLTKITIKEANNLLVEREVSSLDLTKACLEEIEKKDDDLHAFLVVVESEALANAQRADEILKNSHEASPLCGIPVALKDNILVKDIKATTASRILENYVAPFDATVTEKLKAAGAVILGKTNLDEFAMGSSTENSSYGATKNPRDLTRVPGGSSGGSAAAVAAGETVFALGSDTGGSIRQPASFTGVVGFKPTYGTVSRHGLIAMASSLDQIGPICKTAEDAQIVFEAILGKDPLDSTSVEWDWEVHKKENLSFDIENIKIGVPREYFTGGIDPQVGELVKNAIKKLEKEGAQIKEISLPHASWALATYYIVMPAEVSANLARFDGIKYGYSTIKAGREVQNLMDIYLESRGQGFGSEARRRVMLGTYILSAGYHDAYYVKAQKVRRKIVNDFNDAFSHVDLIVTPTSPTVAFKFGEKTKDPLSMYLADIYTVSANLAGLPGISLPCGAVDNLPVGIQFMGKAFSDFKVLKMAQFFETL